MKYEIKYRVLRTALKTAVLDLPDDVADPIRTAENILRTDAEERIEVYAASAAVLTANADQRERELLLELKAQFGELKSGYEAKLDLLRKELAVTQEELVEAREQRDAALKELVDVRAALGVKGGENTVERAKELLWPALRALVDFESEKTTARLARERVEKYPEHAKLHAVRADCETIGQFIEWLRDNGITLCETYNRPHSRRDGEYLPTPKTIPTLLAERFGIDQNRIEAEKRQIIQELRELNRPGPSDG
jgi:hypothetical protein